MNERIIELAEQAGMYIVDDKFSTYGRFAEKFAELIVKECIDIVPWQYESKIKEHFGVEE